MIFSVTEEQKSASTQASVELQHSLLSASVEPDNLLPVQRRQLSVEPQHTFARSSKRVMGICCLNETVYVVRADSPEIEQYHAGEFTGSLTVPLRTGWLSGIAASAVYNCLYVGANLSVQLHRVDLASTHQRPAVWYVPKWPAGLSVTPAEEIVVTCVDKGVVAILLPPNGIFSKIVPLYESGISKPWHAVVLPSGLLAVSSSGPCHRIWLVDRNGTVKRWYGSQGRGSGELCHPRGLLPWGSSQNSVLVCDRGNNRIAVVDFDSSQSDVLARDISGPVAAAVDATTRCLYVAQYTNDKGLLVYRY